MQRFYFRIKRRVFRLVPPYGGLLVRIVIDTVDLRLAVLSAAARCLSLVVWNRRSSAPLPKLIAKLEPPP